MNEAAAVKAGIERAKLEKLFRQQQTTTTSEEGPRVANSGYEPLGSWQNTRLVPPDVPSHLLYIVAGWCLLCLHITIIIFVGVLIALTH